MDTDKITKFYEEAIIKINNASESSKNEIAYYWIGYYTNLSANKLIEYDITKDEAMEIANRIRLYKENGFSQEISNAKAEQPIKKISLTKLFDNTNPEKTDDIEEVEAVGEKQKSDTENEDMRVTRTVESIIYSSEKMNLDDALKYIQKEIDKYNNYELKSGKRFNENDAGSVKEIVRKLELYKQGLIDDYEKFKTLDEAVNGHIKYAETLGLDERIGCIDKAIDYYNNTSSDKFTKEDTAYITKRLNAYKNTLEEKLNNKDDKNKENKESKIKVVGKRVCKWISKHKRQILIGVGCAAIATGLFAISASAIPTLMAANSANWWIAKSVGNVALMNTLHANNIALGAKIGAVFAAKTGAWTIPAGAIIGKSALVSAVAGISGFSVSSIASAIHKKATIQTDSLKNSKKETKIKQKKDSKSFMDFFKRKISRKNAIDLGQPKFRNDFGIEVIDLYQPNLDKRKDEVQYFGFQTGVMHNVFNNNMPDFNEQVDESRKIYRSWDTRHIYEIPYWEKGYREANKVFTDKIKTQENIYVIAYEAGLTYARSKKTPEDKKKVQEIKEKLNLDNINKNNDWSLGFNRAIEDFNKKTNMTSEYLDLEQLNKLNPGANITFDELHPNILYSDIDANLLTLPNGWYYNEKNGITNKHNTETGVYQTYTVEKYQEDRDKPSSHKR